jgi:hypothetical protein
MGAMPVPVAIRMESVTGSLQDEVAVRAVNLDGAADGQVGQVGEVSWKRSRPPRGSRTGRSGFRWLPRQWSRRGSAACRRVRRHGGDELAGGKGKALQLVEDKLEVVALRRFGDAVFFSRRAVSRAKVLTCQGKFENTPYYCLEAEVSTPTARGGQTLVRLKMRNLLTRAVFDKTFKAGDKFKEPDLEMVEASYLYSDGEGSYFLDQETFDTLTLAKR